ncbi:hypothetical protein Btru_069034 [Bulinus truncatus]|nr:hypothetical protein Btru_069034 [Bulinus truncatus]
MSDKSESFKEDSLSRMDSNITTVSDFSGTDIDQMHYMGPSLSQFSLISTEDKMMAAARFFIDYDHGMSDLLQKLPSRQLENVADLAARTLLKKKSIHPYRLTIRLNRDESLEQEFVDSIDHDLHSSSELTEYLDEAVRTIPTSLSKKRNIKHKISNRMKKPERGFPLCRYWLSKNLKRLKFKWRRLTRFFNLWRSHLLVIEGSFGTSVVSYFIFLKWVLLINIPVFLFTFCFLVIPQILFSQYQQSPSEGKGNVPLSVWDFLTGAGGFENSEMYYGYYTNKTVEIILGHRYGMKYVYLVTSAGYYLLCLIILGYSYLRSYRIYYIEAGGPTTNCYFNLFVSGWDYGITSEETSELKHQSLYNEIKEYLSGQQKHETGMDRDQFIRIWLIRLMTWSLVLGILTLSGYMTLVVSTKLSISIDPQETLASESVMESLTTPIILSSIQLIVPMSFSFLESYEGYRLPKDELYVHMFREMALKGTMLAALVYFWLAIARSEIEYC